MQIFEKLGITDPFDAYAINGSSQPMNKQAWIRCGVVNAHALELLQVQLRNITAEKKNYVANALKDEEGLKQISSWQELMRNIIEARIFREVNEIMDWSKCNAAIELLSFSREELFGFSLSMAKEKNIEGAVSGMLILLKKEEVISAGMNSTICAEFVRFFSQGSLESGKNSSSGDWLRDIRLHLDFLELLSIIAEPELSAGEETSTTISSKIIKKLEEIKISCKKRPREVSTQAWNILKKNSYYCLDSGLPEFVLVESRSLPRSGHHYLKNLLHVATKGKFSYCESYNEPGCCKSNPCGVNSYWRHAQNQQENHLRLIKSHDFLLKDKTFSCTPGMYRIIQIREPFDLLVSWLELAQLSHNKELLKEQNIDVSRIFLYHETSLLEESWEVIDLTGEIMSAEVAKEWLAAKKEYIKSFLAKWVPISSSINSKELHNCGNFLLQFQDMKDPQNLLNLLKIKGYDHRDLPPFRPIRTDVLKRKSTLITELVNMNSELIQEISYEVKSSTPLLADGGNVWPGGTE
jgi:hypothetical protein